jgi:hypothetical protein
MSPESDARPGRREAPSLCNKGTQEDGRQVIFAVWEGTREDGHQIIFAVPPANSRWFIRT